MCFPIRSISTYFNVGAELLLAALSAGLSAQHAADHRGGETHDGPDLAFAAPAEGEPAPIARFGVMDIEDITWKIT